MRTHELSRSLESYMADHTLPPDAIVRAFSRAVADGDIAPPGKYGRSENGPREERVRAVFRDIAVTLESSSCWVRDAAILDSLSRSGGHFPPADAVAVVHARCSTFASAHRVKAKLSSAAARLFQLGHVVLYPAPPELTSSTRLSFAVGGTDAPPADEVSRHFSSLEFVTVDSVAAGERTTARCRHTEVPLLSRA